MKVPKEFAMTELESSTWSFILFSISILIAVGFLADKMWGWLWSDELSKKLYKKSNLYLDKHFIEIIHSDLSKVHTIFNNFFGKRFISFKLIAISTIPATLIALSSFFFEAKIRGIGVDTHSLAMTFIMIASNIPIDLASLFITRYLLSKSKPNLKSISLVLSLDCILLYLLMPIPYACGLWYNFIGIFSISELVITSLKFSLAWPCDILSMVSQLNYGYQYYNFLALCFVIATGAIPTLMYVFIILKDILHIILLKWIYLGFAGLFSYLAEKEYPLTIMLTGLAIIIPLIKLFQQSLPFLKHVFN